MASIRTLSAPAALLLLLPLNSLVLSSTNCPKAAPPAAPSDHDGTCHMNMAVCFGLLKHLMHWSIGSPEEDQQCCDFLDGVVEFEAASCLCATIKTNLMGMEIDIPFSMNMVMNHCGKEVPKEFRCA